MGVASQKAQSLPVAITTATKFFGSPNRIYMQIDCKQSKVLGFLKTGERKLFIRNDGGNIKEILPICVLDFYVHESCQRGGIGKKLFELMLNREYVTPEKLAYDRPSSKLFSFLAKHYNLKQYVPQNNNFVVFNQYFTGPLQHH